MTLTPVNMRNRPHRDNGEGQAGTPPVSYPRVASYFNWCPIALWSSASATPTGLLSEVVPRIPGFGNPYSWEGTEIGKMGAASSRSRLSFFFATFFFLCGRCGWCAKVWSRELDSRLPGRSGPSRMPTLIGRTIKPRLSDGPWAGFGRILRCCPLRRTSIRNSPPPVCVRRNTREGERSHEAD